MIRRKHIFQYYRKTFMAWDLTLEDYIYYLLEPEAAMRKILLEFNKKIPGMNVRQMTKFIEILFHAEEKTNKNRREPWEKKEVNLKLLAEDTFISAETVAKILEQPISEILHMTLEAYSITCRRLWEIIDPSKFVKAAEKWTVDKKGIREVKSIFSKEK